MQFYPAHRNRNRQCLQQVMCENLKASRRPNPLNGQYVRINVWSCKNCIERSVILMTKIRDDGKNLVRGESYLSVWKVGSFDTYTCRLSSSREQMRVTSVTSRPYLPYLMSCKKLSYQATPCLPVSSSTRPPHNISSYAP